MTKYTIETEKPRIMAAFMAIDTLINDHEVTDDLVTVMDRLCIGFADAMEGDDNLLIRLVERDLEYLLASCIKLTEKLRGLGLKPRGVVNDVE